MFNLLIWFIAHVILFFVGGTYLYWRDKAAKDREIAAREASLRETDERIARRMKMTAEERERESKEANIEGTIDQYIEEVRQMIRG